MHHAIPGHVRVKLRNLNPIVWNKSPIYLMVQAFIGNSQCSVYLFARILTGASAESIAYVGERSIPFGGMIH